MMNTLPPEIQKLVDIQEIQQLLSKYAIALDSRHPELLASVFTEDAYISLGGMAAMTPEQYIAGSSGFLPTLDVTQHSISTPLIEIHGDTAVSRCYFNAQHGRNSLGEDCLLLISGHYDDEFVRVEGQWRISKRIGTASWLKGNTDVLGYPGEQGGQPWTAQRECPSWLKEK